MKASLVGYREAAQGAVLRDLSNRGKVRVEGPDRISFLHAMISNEVEQLADYRGGYGTFLTATGKMVSDFYYYRFPDHLLLDLPVSRETIFVETLKQYIIMDDVTLQGCSTGLAHLSIQGPKAGPVLAEMLNGAPPEEPFSVQPVDWDSTPVFWIHRAELADSGFELIGPTKYLSEWTARLEESGIGPLSEEAYQVLRLERGVPLFGVDMSERNNPLEAGLQSAISFDKGCYVGQEVVARATYIGSVPRHLVRLRMADQRIPAQSATLFNSDEQKIGQLTSAAFSPRLNSVIALGYVKRAFSQPGTAILVHSSAEDYQAAEVVKSFLKTT